MSFTNQSHDQLRDEPMSNTSPGADGGTSPSISPALLNSLEWRSIGPFRGGRVVAVAADMLRSHGADRARIAESWPRVALEGTRGPIQFSRPAGISVWQWAWPPIQVVARDPAEPDGFRVLHAT